MKSFFYPTLGYQCFDRLLGSATIHVRGGLTNTLRRAGGVGKQQLGMAMPGPQFTQGVAGQIRQRDETVLVAFTASDMNTMAPGIDITDLQSQSLAQPQPHGIGGQDKDAIAQFAAKPGFVIGQRVLPVYAVS